jgi:hypothetical protein
VEQGLDPEGKNIDKNLISDANLIEAPKKDLVSSYDTITNFLGGNQNTLFYYYSIYYTNIFL